MSGQVVAGVGGLGRVKSGRWGSNLKCLFSCDAW